MTYLERARCLAHGRRGIESFRSLRKIPTFNLNSPTGRRSDQLCLLSASHEFRADEITQTYVVMALLPYKADVRSCHSQQTGLSQIKAVAAVLLLGRAPAAVLCHLESALHEALPNLPSPCWHLPAPRSQGSGGRRRFSVWTGEWQ